MKIAALFPGQGSQSVGMGEDFYNSSQRAKEILQSAEDRLGLNLRDLMFKENDLLSKTEYTQPAILTVSMMAYELFKEAGADIEVTMGHSLGEFGAVCAAGGMEPIDAIELVRHRGRLMQKACEGIDAGMMAVLGLDDETVEKICAEAAEEGLRVWAANYNSPGQIVLAGIKRDLEKMEPRLKEAGAKRSILLNMSVASHCPLLKSAQEPLAEYLERFLKEDFQKSVISNVTAMKYSTKREALELLDRQLIEPVLYKQSIAAAEGDCDIFIEFGGSVLRGLNRKITKKETVSVTDMKSLENALSRIGA